MKRTFGVAAALALLASPSAAHDMFLKLESYLLAPGATATVALVNGTYDKSENAIARERMLDVSIAGPGEEVVSPPLSGWWERDETTWLDVTVGAPGTYVMGVSTRPNTIDLAAADFNEYLRHDGVLDVLEERRRRGELGRDAREIYSKHVKAIYQVGDVRSDAFARRLGYPIEIVPLRNPYALGAGDRLEVRVLRDGEPVSGQLVYASYPGYHGHGDQGGHAEAVRVRTGEDGIAGFELTTAGRWYVRLIHMVELDGDDATHESNWATLTFEISE